MSNVREWEKNAKEFAEHPMSYHVSNCKKWPEVDW